jgi:hypothetical protein
MTLGDEVVIHDPGDCREHESWTRGTIVETVAGTGSYALHARHVVKVTGFKWDTDAPWGPYDGVPEVLVRETKGRPGVEWVGYWSDGIFASHL